VQEVGRELGVRYVLEGSVRKVGNRVRINAQLIDAGNGHHLWAERYDRELTDVFALQDEVTQRIVSALAITLTPGEQERLSQAAEADPEACDMLLRGLERFRRFTRETNAEARGFFERAAALDPHYARGHAALALTKAMDVAFAWTDSRDKALEQALKHGQEALRLDGSVRQVHFALSNVYLQQRRHEDAIAAAQKALELEPSYADGYAMLAQALNYAGRPAEGLQAIQRAMQLNPYPPFFYLWIEGHSYFLMGRYEDAAARIEQVVERNPLFPSGHLGLAAAYGQLGRIADAEWEVEEVLTLFPDFSLPGERQRVPYKNAADLERYIEGLRKAGLN
jgi:adenylate cyclase